MRAEEGAEITVCVTQLKLSEDENVQGERGQACACSTELGSLGRGWLRLCEPGERQTDTHPKWFWLQAWEENVCSWSEPALPCAPVPAAAPAAPGAAWAWGSPQAPGALLSPFRCACPT